MSSSSNPDVHVVIRSADELTTDQCHDLIEKQVGPDNISLIKEKPFSKAVVKTFELGLEKGKKWTLALDADILIKENAIGEVVNVAESLPDNFFMIQARVLDKLFCFARNGGPHLFRTEHCKRAIDLVPSSKEAIRPEGTTVRLMIEEGYHRYKGVEILGIHDFYQSDFDIFRTTFVHGIKFRGRSDYFLSEWSKRMKKDEQYRIAIFAFMNGMQYDFENMPDRDQLKEIFNSFVVKSKQESSVELFKGSVAKFIEDYTLSNQALIKQKAHSTILRSDKPEPVRPKPNSFRNRLFKKIERFSARQQNW